MTADLSRRLTDSVIDNAVRQLPEAYQRLGGPRLRSVLEARRDRLPWVASRFYHFLAEEVDVRATDAEERAEVERHPDGTVTVTLAALDENGRAEAPYFRRRFHADQTREVRVYLEDGDDQADSRGSGPGRVVVRVMGGKGADRLDDSAGAGLRFYDHQGENRVMERTTTVVDDRPYETPLDPIGNPRRDWGRSTTPALWLDANSDRGLLAGVGGHHTRYGFRKYPFRHRQTVRAGYAGGPETFAFTYEGEWRRTNSREHVHVSARVSGLEVLHFYGLGNETFDTRRDEFHRAGQRHYTLAPTLTLPWSSLSLDVGPVLEHVSTELGRGRLIGIARPFGTDGFGQVGVGARLALDTRDRPAARSGVRLALSGDSYPRVWDVEAGFGALRGEAATYLTAPLPLEPTLAVRAGGARVWGRYPFHEAAFLGGFSTVRGLPTQRYAGDGALYGNAELRLRPAGFLGLFALADTGRVFLEGESSGRWHTGLGGGAWVSFLDKTFAVTVARSEGRTRYYLSAGLVF